METGRTIGATGRILRALARRMEGDSGSGLYSFRPPIAATMAGVATIAMKATAKIRSCITALPRKVGASLPLCAISMTLGQLPSYNTSMEGGQRRKSPVWELPMTDVPKLLYQLGMDCPKTGGNPPQPLGLTRGRRLLHLLLSFIAVARNDVVFDLLVFFILHAERVA